MRLRMAIVVMLGTAVFLAVTVKPASGGPAWATVHLLIGLGGIALGLVLALLSPKH